MGQLRIGAGNADELALELDDLLHAPLRDALSAEIKAAIDHVVYLDAMSGPENATLWLLTALRDRPEWQEVRRRASAALVLMP